MLTPGEDMEIAVLKKRGWSISAIARHTGRDVDPFVVVGLGRVGL
jgi:lambda repressor-like predicted transcriptional regulator